MLKIKRFLNKHNYNLINNPENWTAKQEQTEILNVDLFSQLYQLWKASYDISNIVVIIDENDILTLLFENENKENLISFVNDLIKNNSITFIFPKSFNENDFLFSNKILSLKSKEYAILKSEFLSKELFAASISYIQRKNAKVESIHGSLISIYGEGIIIMGKSGIGKSELVLNLLSKNHLFVADDALDIIEYAGELVGKASPVIKDFLEIRGIGIINIKKALGIESIINSTKISLIISLEYLEDISAKIDRLGTAEKFTKIHHQLVPTITIPVSQGRDLASIIEMAVIVFKLKKYDKYNFLKEFSERKKEME